MIWRLILWFFSKFDAEDVHHFSIRVLRVFAPLIRCLPPPKKERAVRIGSLIFRHPIGLAAGFDKNAEILDLLPHFGFAFAEVGTVTPKPQEGNDRPRLFRDIREKRIFNRMGFNNLGAGIVAEIVRQRRKTLPSWFKVGVNLGKNRQTALFEAPKDYASALRPFQSLIDFAVINISSPNTQGLRDLQTVESIRLITQAVFEVLATWERPVPVFLKLAPELETDAIEEIQEVCHELGLAGLILTNTLKGVHEGQEGGWSGSVLTQRSGDILKGLKSRLPVISVGGILDFEEARRRLNLGASLIEIYSGWVFGGPLFVRKILKKL